MLLSAVSSRRFCSLQLALGAPALGDIFVGRNPAAVLHRVVFDGKWFRPSA